MADEKKPDADEAPDEANAPDDKADESPAGSDDRADENEIVAPSVGPHTDLDHEQTDPEEIAKTTSDVDAMGLDKRREVVGGQYGASLAKQAALYGAAIAVIAAIAIGFILLANKFDQPPDKYADEAPWTNSDTPPAQIQ